MAALCLSAQLKSKGDEEKTVSVPVDGSLSSLGRGVKELTVKVSQLLTALLHGETGGDDAGDEEDKDDEDEDSEEAESEGPPHPAKRLRP